MEEDKAAVSAVETAGLEAMNKAIAAGAETEAAVQAALGVAHDESDAAAGGNKRSCGEGKRRSAAAQPPLQP